MGREWLDLEQRLLPALRDLARLPAGVHELQQGAGARGSSGTGSRCAWRARPPAETCPRRRGRSGAGRTARTCPALVDLGLGRRAAYVRISFASSGPPIRSNVTSDVVANSQDFAIAGNFRANGSRFAARLRSGLVHRVSHPKPRGEPCAARRAAARWLHGGLLDLVWRSSSAAGGAGQRSDRSGDDRGAQPRRARDRRARRLRVAVARRHPASSRSRSATLTRIHFRGGSILRTSRTNPTKEPAKLEARGARAAQPGRALADHDRWRRHRVPASRVAAGGAESSRSSTCPRPSTTICRCPARS